MAFDTNWDIDKYKDETHGEHWKLRKSFMETHKTKYPEKKLVTLSKLFSNIEFIGCIYNSDIMLLVEDLTTQVAEIVQYRQDKKNKLTRTFIKASDAVKAPSSKNKDKLLKYDYNSILRNKFEPNNIHERKITNENDWILFKKARQQLGVKGKIIIYQLHTDANDVRVILSRSTFRSNIDKRYYTLPHGIKPNVNIYQLKLNEEIVAQVESEKKLNIAIKSKLAALALEDLKQYCFTIIRTNYFIEVDKRDIQILNQEQTANSSDMYNEVTTKTVKNMECNDGDSSQNSLGIQEPKLIDVDRRDTENLKQKQTAHHTAIYSKIPAYIMRNMKWKSGGLLNNISADTQESMIPKEKSKQEISNKNKEFVPIYSETAAKLMKNMGWNGGGLGKNSTGIREPINITTQRNTAGLGKKHAKNRNRRRKNRKTIIKNQDIQETGGDKNLTEIQEPIILLNHLKEIDKQENFDLKQTADSTAICNANTMNNVGLDENISKNLTEIQETIILANHFKEIDKQENFDQKQIADPTAICTKSENTINNVGLDEDISKNLTEIQEPIILTSHFKEIDKQENFDQKQTADSTAICNANTINNLRLNEDINKNLTKIQEPIIFTNYFKEVDKQENTDQKQTADPTAFCTESENTINNMKLDKDISKNLTEIQEPIETNVSLDITDLDKFKETIKKYLENYFKAKDTSSLRFNSFTAEEKKIIYTTAKEMRLTTKIFGKKETQTVCVEKARLDGWNLVEDLLVDCKSPANYILVKPTAHFLQ